MNDYKSGHIKDQGRVAEEIAKSSDTLSFKIKGMIIGGLAMFVYINFYLGKDLPYMIIAGGILGYFLGGVVGGFFYTKK